MKYNLVFETYKYVGDVVSMNLESCVCFADVNSALKYLTKYLHGKGLVRPQNETNKRVYASFEEYEKELYEQEIEKSE